MTCPYQMDRVIYSLTFSPIFYVSKDLLCQNPILSSLIQTPNSYTLLSYFYLPDNFKLYSVSPILLEVYYPKLKRIERLFPVVLQTISRGEKKTRIVLGSFFFTKKPREFERRKLFFFLWESAGFFKEHGLLKYCHYDYSGIPWGEEKKKVMGKKKHLATYDSSILGK